MLEGALELLRRSLKIDPVDFEILEAAPEKLKKSAQMHIRRTLGLTPPYGKDGYTARMMELTVSAVSTTSDTVCSTELCSSRIYAW